MNNEAQEGNGRISGQGSCFKKVREAFPPKPAPPPPHVLFSPSLSWPVNISAHSWISVKPCHLPVLAKTGPVLGSSENWVSKMTNPKMTGPQPTFSKCPLLRSLSLKKPGSTRLNLTDTVPAIPTLCPYKQIICGMSEDKKFSSTVRLLILEQEGRKTYYGISLVVQWVRTRLPVQRTRFWSGGERPYYTAPQGS